MLFSAAIIVLIGTAFGAPADGMMAMLGATAAPTSMTPPKPCCYPKQFEATLVDLVNNDLKTTTKVVFDSVNGVLGVAVAMVTAPDKLVYQTFNDYNKMITYTVSMADPKKCTQTKITDPVYDPCFLQKSNATTFIASTMIGPAQSQ